MSEKQCSHHRDRRRRLFRRLCACCLIFNFILLVIILIIWAILQPTKPTFMLQDATVFAFNVSSPNFLSSTIQVTIASRNPNNQIGIYYDKQDVYATYNNQQITYFTGIPAVYQGTKGVNVWSPFLSGTNVPIAPYNGVSLSQDQLNGQVMLYVRINGRVRFKVGSWISGQYHLHVNCPAMINLGTPTTGIVVGGGNAIKYQLFQSCGVNV